MHKLRNTVTKGRRAFSMIELVIVVVIIGIIAAIAIPRMSRGTAAAADSALKSNLAILRNAIDLYQTEHNGLYPTASAGATVEELLTQYSNADGSDTNPTKDTANGFIYGPYLRAIPTMPVGAEKGKKTIGATATAGTAWVYDSGTGTVTPNASGNDSAGVAYSSY